MEFRLIVRGALPSNRRGIVDAKQRIRRELHPQLRTLWKQHPLLKDQVMKDRKTPCDQALGDEFARCGFRFVPLLVNRSGAMCSVSVLILRRDEPHSLINAAGDIDGRVKTLLDALQMPRQCSELGVDAKPDADEDPFYVLLEDDRLIYELNILTDTLLVPPEVTEPYRDVVAVISVKTRAFDGNVFNLFGI